MQNFIFWFSLYVLEFEIRLNNWEQTRSNARVLEVPFQKYIQIKTITHSKLLHAVVKALAV